MCTTVAAAWSVLRGGGYKDMFLCYLSERDDEASHETQMYPNLFIHFLGRFLGFFCCCFLTMNLLCCSFALVPRDERFVSNPLSKPNNQLTSSFTPLSCHDK